MTKQETVSAEWKLKGYTNIGFKYTIQVTDGEREFNLRWNIKTDEGGLDGLRGAEFSYSDWVDIKRFLVPTFQKILKEH